FALSPSHPPHIVASAPLIIHSHEALAAPIIELSGKTGPFERFPLRDVLRSCKAALGGYCIFKTGIPLRSFQGEFPSRASGSVIEKGHLALVQKGLGGLASGRFRSPRLWQLRAIYP